MAPAFGQLDERSRIQTALGYIPAHDRDLWLRIGMAIKSGLGEAGFALWDDWSRSSERYREADARSTWRSLRPDGGVTLGTLFFEAKRCGYVPTGVEKTGASLTSSRNTPTSIERGVGEINPPDQHCNRATLAAYAAWKKLPEAFLRSLDLSDTTYGSEKALRIPYFDRTGAEVAVRIRLWLERRGDRDRRFAWRKRDKPRLYGLWRMGTPEYVVLVEGESDCHTLWFHGIPALGIPGASNWNEARDAQELARISRIYVVVEPDAGGKAVEKRLARSAIRERSYLLDLFPFKDPSALHCDDPDTFKIAFTRQSGQCCYCGKSMWLGDIKTFAKAYNYSLAQARWFQCTAEHLHARTDGGDDSPENVAAACWYCNSKRHARKYALSPEKYRQHVVGRLQQGRWHQLR